MEHNTRQDGFYLYPSKSSLIYPNNFRISGKLRSVDFSIKLQVINKITPNQEFFNAKRAQEIQSNQIPTGRAAPLKLPVFSRICVDQGDFGVERLKLAYAQFDKDLYWKKVFFLHAIETLVGEKDIDKLVGHTRKFDPIDFSKKSHVDAIHVTQDLYGGIRKTMSVFSAEDLFYKHIPVAAKSAFEFNFENYDKARTDVILNELMPVIENIFFKETQFDTKQTNFRNYLKRNNLKKDTLIPILKLSESLFQNDLATIVDQIKADEVITRLIEKDEDIIPPVRFLDFWYKAQNHISSEIGNRLLSLTPFRTIIHTLPYQALQDWEKSVYFGKKLPKVDTLAQVYARLFKYRDLLEISRTAGMG